MTLLDQQNPEPDTKNSGQFYQYQSTNDSLYMFNTLSSFQSLLR